jgi:type II secretory pathway pseudopilin PulG
MNGGRGKRSAGYTIVETLIFLAVSGGMFVAAMAFISGRQAKAEFNSSVREVQSAIQDIANDVSDGYYSNLTTDGQQLTCGSNVALGKNSGNNQGKNKDCIFIGKAMQFGPDDPDGDGNQKYNLINLVGKRVTSSGDDVASYTEAQITAVGPNNSGSSTPDTTITARFGAGTVVRCVIYSTTLGFTPAANLPCNSGTKVDTIAFITTFKAADVNNGGSQVDLVVPRSTLAADIGRTKYAAIVDLNQYTEAKTWMNPAGKVFVCLEGGSEQYALLSIGGPSGASTVSSVIEQGKCR